MENSDAKKNKTAHASESDEEAEEKNIFKETVVEGKRHHKACANKDQVVFSWLDENLEELENFKVSTRELYDAYVDMCVSRFVGNAAYYEEFAQLVKKKFPKGSTIKAISDLKGKIKETKQKQKKAVDPNKPVIPKVDMKAVLKEAFMDLKNPREGIMFNRLRKFLISHHPELRYDTHPHKLLIALHMGMRRYFVHLVSGINKLGKYRYWSEEVDEEDKKAEEEEKKLLKEKREAAKKAREEVKKEKQEKDGTADKEVKQDPEDNKKEDQGEKKKKKNRKKKKWSFMSQDDRDFLPKTGSKRTGSDIVHGEPARIEHTFPLAITYMAEPKEASYVKILHYCEKYYKNVDEASLAKILSSGESKGYWDLVKGSGKNAIYQLTVDTFDPSKDDDGIGKIINAILASNEPKVCSVSAIKDYVIEFHPEFKVANLPHLFKKALERGESAAILQRISGIGATGSFKLVKPFLPSPTVLQGSDSGVEVESGNQYIEGRFEATQFLDEYKPRATKRHGRAAAAGFDRNAAYAEAVAKRPQSVPSRKRPAQKSHPATKRKIKEESSEEEESSESEDEVPVKKRKAPVSRKATPVKKTPVKKKAPAKKAASKKPVKRNSRAKKAVSPRKTQEESESEEDDELVSRRNNKKVKAASPKNRGATMNRSYKEESSEEESEADSEEDVPAPSVRPAQKKSQKKKIKASTTPTIFKSSSRTVGEIKLVTPASRKLYPEGKSPPTSKSTAKKGRKGARKR